MLGNYKAGRILKGQLKGDNGEEFLTAMESLDHSALVKVNFILLFYLKTEDLLF